tara:strand:+ start:998 stop:1165 length:168 start_codon:yes stop_codon:yes gene_type:complete
MRNSVKDIYDTIGKGVIKDDFYFSILLSKKIGDKIETYEIIDNELVKTNWKKDEK